MTPRYRNMYCGTSSHATPGTKSHDPPVQKYVPGYVFPCHPGYKNLYGRTVQNVCTGELET